MKVPNFTYVMKYEIIYIPLWLTIIFKMKFLMYIIFIVNNCTLLLECSLFFDKISFDLAFTSINFEKKTLMFMLFCPC